MGFVLSEKKKRVKENGQIKNYWSGVHLTENEEFNPGEAFDVENYKIIANPDKVKSILDGEEVVLPIDDDEPKVDEELLCGLLISLRKRGKI